MPAETSSTTNNSSDRNQKKQAEHRPQLTSSTSSSVPTRTSQSPAAEAAAGAGGGRRREETANYYDHEPAGNTTTKKAIESRLPLAASRPCSLVVVERPPRTTTSSISNKGFYGADSSKPLPSAGNARTLPRPTSFAVTSNEEDDEDEETSPISEAPLLVSASDSNNCGILWDKRLAEKTPSQDSIIVQVQVKTSALSPYDEDEDDDESPISPSLIAAGDTSTSSAINLADSMYNSQTSTSTVVKRFDGSNSSSRKPELLSSESGGDPANGLPSYELASSAFVQSNAYAEMCASRDYHNTISQQPYSSEKINQYDRSPPMSPNTTTNNISKSITSTGIGQVLQHGLIDHHVTTRENSLEPIGEEERLVQAAQAFINSSQPFRSKRSEILRYFSAAKTFQVRVVGGDVQITDADGCPLFDAYQELDCRRRWWNVEAYGDRVLLMREELSVGDGASSWGSRVTITDWNGELFGYLITGDPLRLESAERSPIGRFCSQPAVVNNAACSNVTSIPKACWACYSVGAEDGREQQLARLETYQRIVFVSEFSGGSGQQQHSNFHMKLMILAGAIRLVGALTVNPVSDCLALTKFFCNCCAYK